jgi:hypothetical protein
VGRVDSEDLIAVDLTEQEQRVLRRGTWEWGGPAYATDALAVAVGCNDLHDFDQFLRRMRAALEGGEPMSQLDWTRLVFATEIVFASEVVGSGLDWSTTSGMSDEESIVVLRGLQRKLRKSGALSNANF